MKEGPIIVPGRKTAISKVEVDAERQTLKTQASEIIDTLDPTRVRNLLQHIENIESFLLDTQYKKEVHFRKKKKFGDEPTAYNYAYSETYRPNRKDSRSPTDIFIAELKKVMFGIINVMPFKKIRELEAYPDRFASFLKGEKLEELRSEAPDPSAEVDEPEPEEEPIVQVIAEVVKQKWTKLPWGQNPEAIIRAIKEIFAAHSVDVKVEFFRPEKPYANDFVVVAEATDEKEKGVLVPRPGFRLDVHLALDLFEKARAGDVVTGQSVAEFPRVRREHGVKKEVEKEGTSFNFNETYWRVTKLGKLEKYAKR
ncbi:MAG: hypothetical protein WD991_01655 [Candidatus Paceibacterota bacterium]